MLIVVVVVVVVVVLQFAIFKNINICGRLYVVLREVV